MMAYPTQHFQIHDLTFERNDVVLFHDIHCTLHNGDLLQISGANGSGKSTLLRILAGFIQPEHGKILWQDKCIFTEAEEYQQHVHYLGHQNGIKHNLSVYENLQLRAALNAQLFDAEKIKKIIEYIDLTTVTHSLASTLSAGQRRRLALARLLLHPAALWILDEPMAALDSNGFALLTDMLNQHLNNNGMVIMATHQTLPLMKPCKTIQLQERNAHA
jgi:heme exporter protein A